MTAQVVKGQQTDSILVSAWKGFRTGVRLLAYNRVGFIGFLVVVFMVLLSYAGPLIIELDTKTKIDRIYITPTLEHPLGTDHQGRDIWSQIVNGGKDVIYVAFLAALISTVIAVVFGTLSGFIGGWLDSAIMSVTDIILTIPQFPLLAVLAAFISLNSLTLLGVLMGLLNWPTLLRALRAQALSLKQRDFIEAARALDLGVMHIVLREMVPNMMPYIVVSFASGHDLCRLPAGGTGLPRPGADKRRQLERDDSTGVGTRSDLLQRQCLVHYGADRRHRDSSVGNHFHDPLA